MKIRTLHPADAARLLAFELENRDWFEQHVEARAPEFYTPEGVAAHIEAHLGGDMHPCVLLDDGGHIIGRANLRRIDTGAGTGEVGYRIALSHARQGLASLALEHLKQVARAEYGLRMLNAYISAGNLGSTRVMEKCNFIRAGLTPPIQTVVRGEPHDSYLYQCKL